MSSDSPLGCLTGTAAAVAAVVLAPFLALYALATGKSLSADESRPRLPYLAISRMHSEDRPALTRARKAAEGCIDALFGNQEAPLSDEVRRSSAGEIVELLEKVYELGERLAEARAFARQHDPDRIAREQAELEIRMDASTSLEERSSLKQAMEALSDRARHAATVHQEIRTLSAQLTAASSVLESLQARLARTATDPTDRTIGAESLLEDVRERQRDARQALEAYSATARELDKLR